MKNDRRSFLKTFGTAGLAFSLGSFGSNATAGLFCRKRRVITNCQTQSELYSQQSPILVEPEGIRVRLAVRNNTARDLWIVWSQDTHQAPQTDYLPNGHSVERKSRKIGSNASFRIDVYKNNGGKPGKFLGGFNHAVSIVTTYDFAQLIAPRIRIGGYDYVDFSYVSGTQVASTIARILASDFYN